MRYANPFSAVSLLSLREWIEPGCNPFSINVVI